MGDANMTIIESLKKVADFYTVSEMMAIERGEKRLSTKDINKIYCKQMGKDIVNIFLETGRKYSSSKFVRLLISKCLDNWEQTKGARLY